jgi:hypothetical protein
VARLAEHTITPKPRTYLRGFGTGLCGEFRCVRPRTHLRRVLWYGVTGFFIAVFHFVLVTYLPDATGNAAQGSQGVLEVRVKDHREAISDFSKLMLTIDKIALSPKAGLKFWQARWQEVAPATTSVDLTQHIGSKSARLFRGTVEPRAFEAIHLKLKGVEGSLKNSQTNVQIKNLIGPVKLNFAIKPQVETLIVLDLVVMDMSDHPPRAYELSFRGYELYTNGKLVDKIPPGP